MYDLIVIGGGACGIMGAISAAREGKKVLLLEKLSHIAAKLKATGGGRCNLTNTLPNESFMEKFGRDGRFMRDVLQRFDHRALREFMDSIGVATHAPDGFRIFPVGHSSQTIIDALRAEMERLGITVVTAAPVTALSKEEYFTVTTPKGAFEAHHLLIATGGMGYPQLGAEGDGYRLAAMLGHSVTELFPAMMPLSTEEKWVSECRADTLPGVELRVDIKKYRKLKAVGDLIFTKEGIRGPVVLDFSREITPLLHSMERVPLLSNLVRGRNREELYGHIKAQLAKEPGASLSDILASLIPGSLATVICGMLGAEPAQGYSKLPGVLKEQLIDLLITMPLTITGHDGFAKAMITRGGISLKEIDPKSMESRLVGGLYFCGEVVDIDGPCGGYNLQWSFASGFVAGQLGNQKQ